MIKPKEGKCTDKSCEHMKIAEQFPHYHEPYGVEVSVCPKCQKKVEFKYCIFTLVEFFKPAYIDQYACSECSYSCLIEHRILQIY